MTTRHAVAIGLLFFAAVAYGIMSIELLVGGAFYPSVLGGQVAIGGGAWPLLMGSAVLAALIAVAVRQQRHEAAVAVAFGVWLLLALVAAAATEPAFGVSVALSALVPLALVRPRMPSRLRV